VGIPEVGQAAPDFALRDQSKAMVSLKDLTRDGSAVIVFYRGYWCPFCKRHLRKIQKNLAAIHKREAHVAAISIDPPELSQALAAVQKLEFPLLSDPDSKVIDAYGVRNDQPGVPPGLPHPATFVIDRQGVVRFAEVRPDPQPRTSPELIVRELDRLLGVQRNPEWLSVPKTPSAAKPSW
jgi:peroxiredoxin